MADNPDEPSSASVPAVNGRDSNSAQLANHNDIISQAKLLQNRTNGDCDSAIGSAEALAKGISSVLAGVIRDFDSRAEDASTSQDKLCSAIDRLTAGNCNFIVLKINSNFGKICRFVSFCSCQFG